MKFVMNLRKAINHPRNVPYVLLSPFFILWGVFIAFPVGYAIWISFQKWEGLAKFRYVGLLNYTRIFQSSEVIAAYLNIAWYVVGIVSILTIVPLLSATLLSVSYLKFKSVFRAGFFLPYLCSLVIVSLIFSVLFAPGGLVNGLLPFDIPWLTSTLWSKPSVVIATTWSANGFWVIIYLGVLQSVPVELYEAAKIDGASAWSRFFYITIPMIAPVITVVVVTGTIGTLISFAIPKILTDGGPLSSSTTPVLELYRAAFLNFRLGYASAFGVVLAGIIITVAVCQITLSRRMEMM